MKRLDESLPSLRTPRERTGESTTIGTPPLDPGSTTSLISAPVTRPAETDLVSQADRIALESLERLIGSPIVEKRRSKNDPQFGYDEELAGYETAAKIPETAREFIRELTRPAERDAVKPGLTAMALAMPSQNPEGPAVEAWMELVWMAVEEFPADVINEALKRSVRRDEFRPTPAKIRDDCHWLNRRRHALRRLVGAD